MIVKTPGSQKGSPAAAEEGAEAEVGFAEYKRLVCYLTIRETLYGHGILPWIDRGHGKHGSSY